MIIRLYTGEDRQSHFEDIILPWAEDDHSWGQTGPLPVSEGGDRRDLSEGRAVQHRGVNFARNELAIS
jgi:hypothetical protein